MSLPDTNQASEDEQTRAIYEAMQKPYLSERHDAINAIIRTEKLKLLAEVRERVVGENHEKNITRRGEKMVCMTCGDDDFIGNWCECSSVNEAKEKQRDILTKLEAEL